MRTRTSSARFLGLVKELAEFREAYAQRNNVPRNRVYKDDALLELASTKPQSAQDLSRSRLLLREARKGPIAEGILAAIKAGATDGPSIQANLAAVSGSTGGTECDTFSACVELLDAGEEITYVAVSGSGPINEDNDPSSAFIGVYEYDENNVPVWVDAVFGEV